MAFNEMETAGIAVPSELTSETSGVLLWAQSLSIQSAGDYEDALTGAQRIKQAMARVVDFFRPHKENAHKAHRALCDAETRLLTDPRAAEQYVKSEMMRYERQERDRAEKERQRLQAEAEERARRERERLEKQAAKLKTPEKQAEKLEQAASIVVPVIHVQSNVPKMVGASMRTSWVVDSVDKAALIVAAAADANLQVYLSIDESALRKIGSATKGQLQIPGVTWREERTMAIIGGR